MDWSVIVLALFEAIRQCMEDRQSRDEVERGLNNPGFREAGRIRRVLRKTGLNGHDLRKATHEAMDELESMTQEEVGELVTDAIDASPSEIHVSTNPSNPNRS